jgi:hypothetical protein
MLTVYTHNIVVIITIFFIIIIIIIICCMPNTLFIKILTRAFRTFRGFLVVVFTSVGIKTSVAKIWCDDSLTFVLFQNLFTDDSSIFLSCMISSGKESLLMESWFKSMCDIWRGKCRVRNDLWIKRVLPLIWILTSHLQVSLLCCMPFWEGSWIYRELFFSGLCCPAF